MDNPYASPTSIVSQPESRAGVLHVRWTRPTYRTFAHLAVFCGFSTGVFVGLGGFVGSLLGAEMAYWLGPWRVQGVAAGLVGILIDPLAFVLFGCFLGTLYPVFWAGVKALEGPRLYFRAKDIETLAFSCLRLRSYMKLTALFGFLAALAGVALLVVMITVAPPDDYTVTGVPLLFNGTARLIWVVSTAPLLYAIYGAVLGILTYIPFRLITGLTRAAVPSEEVRTGE